MRREHISGLIIMLGILVPTLLRRVQNGVGQQRVSLRIFWVGLDRSAEEPLSFSVVIFAVSIM